MTTIEAPTEAAITSTATVMQRGEFKRVLDNAILCASSDDARPAINAVRLRFSDQKLMIESTDSYALYRETLKIDDSGSGEAIISLADAKTLAKMVDKQFVTVTFEVGTLRVMAGLGDSSVNLRNVDAQYPDTDSIMQRYEAGEVTTIGIASKLLGKLGRIKTQIKYGTTGAPWKFTFADDKKPFIASVENIEVLIVPIRVSNA